MPVNTNHTMTMNNPSTTNFNQNMTNYNQNPPSYNPTNGTNTNLGRTGYNINSSLNTRNSGTMGPTNQTLSHSFSRINIEKDYPMTSPINLEPRMNEMINIPISTIQQEFCFNDMGYSNIKLPTSIKIQSKIFKLEDADPKHSNIRRYASSSVGGSEREPLPLQQLCATILNKSSENPINTHYTSMNYQPTNQNNGPFTVNSPTLNTSRVFTPSNNLPNHFNNISINTNTPSLMTFSKPNTINNNNFNIPINNRPVNFPTNNNSVNPFPSPFNQNRGFPNQNNSLVQPNIPINTNIIPNSPIIQFNNTYNAMNFQNNPQTFIRQQPEIDEKWEIYKRISKEYNHLGLPLKPKVELLPLPNNPEAAYEVRRCGDDLDYREKWFKELDEELEKRKEFDWKAELIKQEEETNEIQRLFEKRHQMTVEEAYRKRKETQAFSQKTQITGKPLTNYSNENVISQQITQNTINNKDLKNLGPSTTNYKPLTTNHKQPLTKTNIKDEYRSNFIFPEKKTNPIKEKYKNFESPYEREFIVWLWPKDEEIFRIWVNEGEDIKTLKRLIIDKIKEMYSTEPWINNIVESAVNLLSVEWKTYLNLREERRIMDIKDLTKKGNTVYACLNLETDEDKDKEKEAHDVDDISSIANKSDNTVEDRLLENGLYRSFNFDFIPPFSELKQYTKEQLENVQDFQITNENGLIYFINPVDITYVDFDEVVRIDPGVVSLYDRIEELPERGQKLNQRMIIKLLFNEEWSCTVDEVIDMAKESAKTNSTVIFC